MWGLRAPIKISLRRVIWMSGDEQLNLLMGDLDLSDCTDEEKEMYKKDIERYLNHRKKRITLKKGGKMDEEYPHSSTKGINRLYKSNR